MAPSTAISSLTDELVASLIPTSTAASKVRRLKEAFSRWLRNHNYARTNQFEVIGRLEGLQEKFIILNRDDLADALRARLEELQSTTTPSEKWLPDVLHQFLQLSDNPVLKPELDDLSRYPTSGEAVPQSR